MTSISKYILLALVAVMPLLGQFNRLVPGELAKSVLPPVFNPQLFNGEEGFFIDVPEDALRLEFELTTAPPEANVNLYVRFGTDVIRGDAGIVADFSSEQPGGAERIEIRLDSFPVLQAGRYFVAIEAGFRNPRTFVFLRSALDRSVGRTDLEIFSTNDFEDAQTQGWERNYPEPDPIVNGSTTGQPDGRLDVFREDGSGPRNRTLRLTGTSTDSFVAPIEYLGALGLLSTDARLEFDLAYESSSQANQPVEVRVLGESTVYRWQHDDPPTRRLQRYFVNFEPELWERVGGRAEFAEVMANVQRVEIRANYALSDGVCFLDNVTLLGAAESPKAPIVSDFEVGADGWIKNVAGAPFLEPRILGTTRGDIRARVSRLTTGGNPAGFLQLTDLDDINRDALVAPPKFLGNLRDLGPETRIEFDRKHDSSAGATRGVEVRLIGFGGAYGFVGAIPRRTWTNYSIELKEENFFRLAGNRSFDDVMRAVQRIEVTMDEVGGREDAGFDNFRLLSPPPVLPVLRTEPTGISFNAVESEVDAGGKEINLTSTGEPLDWIAAASTDAPWIQLSSNAGTTPSLLVISANPTGLGPGNYQGTVEIAWSGSPDLVEISVFLTVISQTAPIMSEGGVVNAANFRPNSEPGGELTGGMFFAIFGRRLATSTAVAQSIPLTSELGETNVTMGGIPAPLVFASDSQIVGVVPQGLSTPQANRPPGAALKVEQSSPPTSAEVVVIVDGIPSPPETIRLIPLQPLLFSQNQRGEGPGAILNFVGAGTVQLNTFDDPARPTQAISLFGTGFGPTRIPVLDGFAASTTNPITGAIRVTVGGIDAQILFAGLSPSSPHLYQVNAIIPVGSPIGCEVPIKVFVDSMSSNEVTAAITANAEPCR